MVKKKEFRLWMGTIKTNLKNLINTFENKKCKQFVSWPSEPGALVINAVTIKWTNLKFYAFPLFALILRALVKVKMDKAEGTFVVHNWPYKPWYSLFVELIVGELVFFKPISNSLTSSYGIKNPRFQHWSLMRGIVSAKPSRENTFLRKHWK